MTLRINIAAPTREVTNDQLELANQVINGHPAVDAAYDVLQRSVVDALNDAGVPVPWDTETECVRTALERRVGLDETTGA